jgi:hypothetical protein
MEALKKKALKILNSEGLRNKHFIGSGYYRRVYGFSFYGRKYVVKLDVHDDSERGGSIAEANCWLRYKDTDKGKVLAPVLAYGDIDGRGWCIMPKLQMITKVFATGKKKNVRPVNLVCQWKINKIILKASEFVPGLKTYIKRGGCEEFGDDLHFANWGMTSKGVWLIIDYSEGGNEDTYWS